MKPIYCGKFARFSLLIKKLPPLIDHPDSETVLQLKTGAGRLVEKFHAGPNNRTGTHSVGIRNVLRSDSFRYAELVSAMQYGKGKKKKEKRNRHKNVKNTMKKK